MAKRHIASIILPCILLASQAVAQPAHRADGASSPPKGLYLGVDLGVVLLDDRSGIGLDGGGPERIDAYMRAIPGRFEALSERLGGAFTIDGDAGGYAVDAAVTFGLAAGYQFRPGWLARVDIASYLAEVTAAFPLTVQTDQGPQQASGVVSTDVRGILADLSIRKQWRIRLYRPEIGAGIRLHRVSPEETLAEIAGIGFFVDRADAQNDFSPMAQVGLSRAFGERIRVGVEGIFAGRSLRETGGGERWALEPEIRLTGSFSLDGPKEPGPPKSPSRPGGAPDGSSD